MGNLSLDVGIKKDTTMQENTRRDFLKTSAAMAAGVVPASHRKAEAGDSPRVESTVPSPKTYTLTRQIPVEEGYDVAVAGGGPAGVAAAVCAARLGAKVFLAEAMGCLGGMGSSGLVSTFDPMANGEIQLVRGFMGEVVETMNDEGFMQSESDFWRTGYHKWSRFNPEGYKYVLDRKVEDAGVKVRFYTRVIEADVDPATRTVRGVITSNVECLKYIKANAFIDCTGDAVLTDLCGADSWRAGKDTPKIMPATMTTLWCGTTGLGNGTLRRLYFDAAKEGLVTYPSKKLVGLSHIDDDLYYLNGGHLFDMDALDSDSLTEGAMKGRVIANDFRKMFESHPKMNLALAATSSLVGVRESRRIKGEYVFNKTDMETRRLFPDTIGVYCKACDIHPYKYSDKAMKDHEDLYRRNKKYRPGNGEMFAMPYGILVPKGWKNLWTAGRCARADIIGQGSLRCQPYCSQMGQAAGTAAVQALQHGQSADNLNTERLVKALRQQDVYLPQEKLSSEMTRT